MPSFDALRAGASGLRAARAGVEATSQNVSNASTPGFVRRNAETSTAAPIERRGVWIGQGVQIDRIGRHVDAWLVERRTAATGQSSASAAADQSLGAIESLVEPQGTPGLRDRLDAFFDALGTATTDPSDAGLRRSAVVAGDRLASQVRDTAAGFTQAKSDLVGQMKAITPSLNDNLAEIARLNGAIAEGGGAVSAGDLADRRDMLIQEVAQQAGVTTHMDGDGQATVLLGGHAVVSGKQSRGVSVGTDSSGFPKVTVSASSGSLDVTSAISGRIGGTLDAWERIDNYLDGLDTFAADFSAAMNTAHAAGYDLSGVAGGPIFTGTDAATLEVDPAIDADPKKLAFRGSATSGPGDGTNLANLLTVESNAVVSGTTPPGEALANLTDQIGTEAAAFADMAVQDAAMLDDVEAVYAAITGVDLDEEATNLIKLQAAYQASAAVVRTTDEMLQTLMGIV